MSHWLHFPPEEILINCAHIVCIETVTSNDCPEKDQIDGFHAMKITMANGKEFIFPYHEDSDGDKVRQHTAILACVPFITFFLEGALIHEWNWPILILSILGPILLYLNNQKSIEFD